VTYQDAAKATRTSRSQQEHGQAHGPVEGTRSTGEFSTLLQQLLEEGAAKFRSGGQDTIRNRSAYVYSFGDTRELSRWRIEAPSQLYYRLSRDPSDRQRDVARSPHRAAGRAMPALFPFDTIETSADNDFTRLGTSGPYRFRSRPRC